MRAKLLRKMVLILFPIFVFFGCQKNSDLAKKNDGKSKLNIFVSILPQKYLVDSIGGKYVKTVVMVDPGQDPHEYDPTPQKILELSKCEYYVEIGLPFEEILVHKAAAINKNIKFINSAAGINTLIDPSNPASGNDPHIWISLKNDKIIAQNIFNALSEAAPKDKEYFKDNFEALMKELNSADEEITSILKPYKGRTFLVFHPAFGYFAKDYGLVQESIEVEEKSPNPRDFLNTMQLAKRQNIKTVFVEPEFDKTAADTLAKAIGADVVVINPLSEDIPKSLVDIANKLKESFIKQNT